MSEYLHVAVKSIKILVAVCDILYLCKSAFTVMAAIKRKRNILDA